MVNCQTAVTHRSFMHSILLLYLRPDNNIYRFASTKEYGSKLLLTCGIKYKCKCCELSVTLFMENAS